MNNVNWVKIDGHHADRFYQSDVHVCDDPQTHKLWLSFRWAVAQYREYQIDEFATTIWNSYGEVFVHDSEVIDLKPDEHLRVLDDSPDASWVEWEQDSYVDASGEYHVIAQKKQKDGRVLIKVDESYPGIESMALSPLYFLVKDLKKESTLSPLKELRKAWVDHYTGSCHPLKKGEDE